MEAWVFSEVETETMTARKHSASSKRAHICFLQMWNAMRSPNSPPPTQPTQPYTPKAAYYTIQWKYPTHDVTGRTTIFIDICCEILVREYFKKIKIKNIFTVRITAGILNMTNILHAVCNQLDYSRFRAQWKVISDIMNAHTAVHCGCAFTVTDVVICCLDSWFRSSACWMWCSWRVCNRRHTAAQRTGGRLSANREHVSK